MGNIKMVPKKTNRPWKEYKVVRSGCCKDCEFFNYEVVSEGRCRCANEETCSVLKDERKKAKKSLFKITHIEEIVGVYYVEAESKDDALLTFKSKADNGEIDFGDMELVDSRDAVAVVR